MEKGYNSDIQVAGSRYHVQTEDWGEDNPFLVSKIFKNGAVLKTYKTPYDKIPILQYKSKQDAIRDSLKRQHAKILDLLVSGQLFT